MAQHEVELILLRQFASCLAMPIFIVDPMGTLLYYNEPAEAILGQRFSETGELSKEALATTFHPMDDDGRPLPIEQVPVIEALVKGEPVHKFMCLKGIDGVKRRIEATGFPLIGQDKKIIASVSIFWEVKANSSSDQAGQARIHETQS